MADQLSPQRGEAIVLDCSQETVEGSLDPLLVGIRAGQLALLQILTGSEGPLGDRRELREAGTGAFRHG